MMKTDGCRDELLIPTKALEQELEGQLVQIPTSHIISAGRRNFPTYTWSIQPQSIGLHACLAL